jgi:hypothetical protein
MGALIPGSALARPFAQAPIFFYLKSYFFDLKPHAKFRFPMVIPSGRKVIAGDEEEEKKKHHY